MPSRPPPSKTPELDREPLAGDQFEVFDNTHTSMGHVDAEQGDEATADCLIVLKGDEPGRRLFLRSEVVIGRGEDCDEMILDTGISRRHVVIRRSVGAYVVTDLGSRNGTRVNGRRVKEARIEYGDEISIGENTVLTLARRRHYEDRYAAAQKMQALGQLASGVSHDFNNLLGALFANITFLGTKTYDRETAQCLGEMEVAIRRAVDLTRQLSEFGRKKLSESRPVDLHSLVEEIGVLMRRTLPRNIELVTRMPQGLGVLGDASRLSQVLMNLAVNAKDAMPQGGQLVISGHSLTLPNPDHPLPRSLVPGPYVVLTVEDTGHGIDPATLERIFEPFFTTKPRGRGTGLGLATAQAILRAHGGLIEVASTVGKGTRFDLLLPALTVARADTTIGPAPGPSVSNSIHGTVLVADDDELIRTAISRVIREAGGEVVVAADGAEALRRYAEHTDELDLLVLDLDMPRVDGAGVLEVLRSVGCTLPIVIISGHDEPDRIEQLEAMGIREFLAKPFDSHTLQEILSRNLPR